MRNRLLLVSLLLGCMAAMTGQVVVGITTRESIRTTGLPTDGDSGRLAISKDGRFIVYESDASNIVGFRDSNDVSDIFLYDTLTGDTERVSISWQWHESIGGASFRADVSADGRFIVFQSAATNLAPAPDTNGATDIFVRDRLGRTTFRVSVSSGGEQANGASHTPVISDDGAYVAFISAATNLVPGDTNGTSDIFRRHITSGVTERVSVSNGSAQANASSSDPAINENGSIVAFTSGATNLVAGDTNGVSDVFRRNLQTPGTIRVSVSTSGTQGNDFSRTPSLSADGNLVAFRSTATNLVTGDTNGANDIFVRNVNASNTTRVSVSSGGAQGNGASNSCSINSDGRYVIFDSSATNLVAGDTNGVTDVFRRDLQTNATVRLSVASGGAQSNGASADASVNGDGSRAVFQSAATNLVSGDSNGFDDGFLRNTASAETSIVTMTFLEVNHPCLEPSMSASGRFVAFESISTTLVPGDTNGAHDIFVRDRLLRTTKRVSVSGTGVEANADSHDADIDASGQYVVFTSAASNLVQGDNNGRTDVFVRDTATGTTTRVSVASNGAQANNYCEGAQISQDGRFVLFESLANNLVVGDTNNAVDVFLYDRVTGQTTRESIGTGGVQADTGCFNADISADGNIIVFVSGADNLVVGDPSPWGQVFLRNRANGTTQKVSVSTAGIQSNNGGSDDPTVSGDGLVVAFSSGATNLVAGDTNGKDDVFIRNVATNTTTRASVSTGGVEGNGDSFLPSLSYDGSRIAFISDANNLVFADSNFFDDVFIRIVSPARTIRASMSSQGVQADGGQEGEISLSASGHAVSFSTWASNLVLFDTNVSTDVFVHDLALVPSLFTVVRGVVEAGDAGGVVFPENERLILRPGITFTTSQAPIEMVAEGRTLLSNPTRLEFAVEFHATSPSIRQTIEMFNFDTQAYELAHTLQATLNDAVALVVITSNPGRFVSSSGLMRSRVSYKAVGPVFAYPWRSRIDHIRWTVY